MPASFMCDDLEAILHSNSNTKIPHSRVHCEVRSQPFLVLLVCGGSPLNLQVTVAPGLITTVLRCTKGLRCSRLPAMDEPMDVDGPRGVKRKADHVDVTNSRRIRALDPDVINKIAAGEIIVAPVHALKELIENAVDAGSTALEVLAKDGGLKMLQITDNGSGIDVCAFNPNSPSYSLRFFLIRKDCAVSPSHDCDKRAGV